MVIYKSVTGRTVTIGTYIISTDPGIQLPEEVEELNALVPKELEKVTTSEVVILPAVVSFQDTKPMEPASEEKSVKPQ